MTDENWKPLFRASTSTVTKVLRSHAFLHSRELSADIAENSDKLGNAIRKHRKRRGAVVQHLDRVGQCTRGCQLPSRAPGISRLGDPPVTVARRRRNR